ncbi:MAG: CinA family protein [Gammaproteobacteria bacterium]
MNDEIEMLAVQVGDALRAQGRMLVTAESCTGGWVAQAITGIPGSSGWFDRGFVTYTNAAKQEMLGVREETLIAHGAVSEETVREMAEGALRRSHAQVAVAISGVAGPGGGTPAKPVGMVCFAWAVQGQATRSCTERFPGDRAEVRGRSVIRALRGILDVLHTTG